jgi:glycosyltransferase involved in cell wall biosynthesis
MQRLPTLEEVAIRAGLDGSVRDRALADQLCRHPDENAQVQGWLLQAAIHVRAECPAQAGHVLREARKHLGWYPLPIIAGLLELCTDADSRQAAAYDCLLFAEDALQFNYPDHALEACTAAFMLDSQSHLQITRDPRQAQRIATIYETAAATIPPPDTAAPVPHRNERLKVAIIVPNLVDHVVAYSQRVLYFARHHDRDHIHLHVYSSENHSGRHTPLFPAGCQLKGSEERGPALIEELRSLAVPVHIASRYPHYREAAQQLIRQLNHDGIDAALFITGLSAPIDWLTARHAPVPVKAAIHIGSSLLVPGLDMTFYDNAANISREDSTWKTTYGERKLLLKGTDLQELENGPALARSTLGIPEEAVILGTLSNHLAQRLTRPFMDTIAKLLKTNPQAHFIAFGSDTLPEKIAFFREQGVAEQVHFGGRIHQTGPALKMLDIYTNEFPVGGSQSVIEAMACGVPVAAMAWSDAHAECAGAQLVGPDRAISSPDIKAYGALVQQWIDHPDIRQQAGADMRARAHKLFDIRPYVQQVLQELEQAYRSKATCCNPSTYAMV